MRSAFILLVALSACTAGPKATLRKAEALLQEAPDSSLVLLEGIDAARLHPRGLRAEQALLLVRAQEACYGFVPTEETEALAAAADYFETRGSAQQRLDAWYRLGRLQSSEGALYRAVVSFEKALAAAQELQDDGATGEVRRELAYNYNASLQHLAAARELYASWQAFERAGREDESRRTLLEYAQAWYNFERYDEAEQIFRTVLQEAAEAADTLTQVRCLQSYAALSLEKTPPEPGNAREMLFRVRDSLNYPLNSADWGVLAYAAALQGQDAEARRCLARSRARVETGADLNRFRFRQYQVAARAGRDAEALHALEQVTAYGNAEDLTALQSAVSFAREDYLQGRRELSEERLRTSRMGIWALLMLLIGVASTLLWYLRARRIAAEMALSEERAETERYIGIAEELQDRLATTSRRLRDTAAGKNEVLERLCEQYYVFEGTDKLQKNLLKEVKLAVEGLREDPKVLARLEQAVDAARDGAASKLRAQLPNCKPEDVKLFVLAASGFSRTAMATLMDKEKGVVNNRLWRLKGRIEESSAPDRELLRACLG
jgi:tetratricopeptide (TPR) repeat protein